jgi:hypothetical protein
MSCRLRLSKGQGRQFGKWDLFDFTVSNVPNPPSNHQQESEFTQHIPGQPPFPNSVP